MVRLYLPEAEKLLYLARVFQGLKRAEGVLPPTVFPVSGPRGELLLMGAAYEERARLRVVGRVVATLGVEFSIAMPGERARRSLAITPFDPDKGSPILESCVKGWLLLQKGEATDSPQKP